MKNFKLLTVLAVFTLFFQGCEDNFLDVQPETEIGGETFFNSADDLEMYLNSLMDWPGFGFGESIALEASDDATSSGSVEFRNIMLNDVTSRQITDGWEWEQLRDINYFLENFDRAEISEAELNHFEGIARFHRARFYMEKVQRFGDVPWYDEVLNPDDEDLYKARDTREFVVNKIFEDYQFAADHVKPSSTVGAVDKWVVKAFMARHALFEGTFRTYHDYLDVDTPASAFLEMAKEESQDLMDEGGFSIHSTGNPDEDYLSLFNNTSLAGNSEIILVNRSIEGERNSGWGPSAFGNYEQSPTKDLLKSYLMADGTYYTDQPEWDENTFVEEFENRDPRLSQTYAYPGWIINNPGTYAAGTAGEPYIQQLNPNFTGYHMIKWFVNSQDSEYQQNVDIPILRYSEVLLTNAEAKAELGELTQTDLDMTVNQLRSRVDMPPMTMNPPVDQMQQDRYPNVSSPEILEIRRERRVELSFEDQRLNDLMRYGAGHLLEGSTEGLYFPELGTYDLTGDGYDNIKLIPHTESIPSQADRETNEQGQTLQYFRAGPHGSDATVILENGDSGNILARADRGTFESPKHYYRPIPFRATQINTNLEQMYGWE
ncbi:MAG: RagB/SusD family nutrient uptake outer membrane protein [Balneolaceae bacterium]